MTPPINPPNHPPTHQTIHPPMGVKFFTDFKSSNRIEISWLVQVLSNFNWFRRPLWGGRWVDGGGGGYGCVGSVPCTHAYMHMYVKHAKHAKHGCLHVGDHLQFLYMYTCACVCACMWWHPQCPQMPADTPHPPAPSPEWHGAQNSKIQ